ncbi:ribosomal protein S5 domain 2-type protein [Microdochium trichocladiopsis]|uniref:Ribosomal protein S5 domain 2-type protein n=1 Tax=Microdochium trichocladiopsis TaxID=1682393 RepID=A0A9P8Y896_9PEZI|nr:ribosomal protein S5 domain 2-type protein [Microdochium trichocladiopsis]KAH7033004.1 ribosomal protein S5 domain 2-type protein [Microdochium trichocladiopsis]
MSEELKDEVEAINSIYGDGCLVESPDGQHVYILSPPGEASSLRIEFPPSYPEEPPAVIGTNSSGAQSRKGDAARELALFRQAVGTVFQPGTVCLFDAIEELSRLLEELAPEEPESPIRAGTAAELQDLDHQQQEATELSQPPPWTISDPTIELKSVFVARCAKVSSTEQAAAFVQHLLASDKKIRSATHNITAWRIKGAKGATFQDCDDDGETAAGGRLLHLMQLMDLWDVMVVVTRWYGGHHLGPRRFALINQAARDAFVKAGFVDDSKTSGGSKKGSGK